MHRPHGRTTRAAAAAALTLLLGIPLSACTGEDAAPREDPEPGTRTAAEGPAPLKTTAKVGEVVGRLGGPSRVRLTSQVRKVVDAWIDAAYLGDYPRTDFAGVFPGFSKGAAAQARADGALMSNASIGADLEEVVALQRRLRIDALAPRGRAVAVTARVVVTMRLGADVERKERVAGSLFMTYDDGDWQVFGYDTTRGRVR